MEPPAIGRWDLIIRVATAILVSRVIRRLLGRVTNHVAGYDPCDKTWHQVREPSALATSECGVTLLEQLDPFTSPPPFPSSNLTISIDPDDKAREISLGYIEAAAVYRAIQWSLSMQQFVVRRMTIITRVGLQELPLTLNRAAEPGHETCPSPYTCLEKPKQHGVSHFHLGA